jgi:UDP-glucose 4-epimerase
MLMPLEATEPISVTGKSPLAGRRVLITGGLGFIGSNLAQRLVSDGAEVTLIDSMLPDYGGNAFNVEHLRGQARINIADVRDPHAMAYSIRGQDVLFNLAGQTSHLDSMRDPVTDLAINVQAQVHILEACRHHNPGIRVVFASTRQLYGRPRYLPVDEAHVVDPVDVNGINKWSGEAYHLLYQKVYGVRASVLRLTNTYGPGMRVKDERQTFVGIWIRNLMEGKPIRIFGDGLQLRDFNHVEDVIDALLLAATDERADGQVFNLGHDQPVNLLDLARLMVALHGRGQYELIPFPSERKRIDIGDYYSDFGRIQRTLGWRPRIALADGMRSTLAYYVHHLEKYV